MSADFHEDLARSHAAEDLPFWEEAYRRLFPDLTGMVSHRHDGDRQRAGVDRTVFLGRVRQVLIDEKVRWRNRKTGRVYEDIALEVWSVEEAKEKGWARKPLLADFIAYAIAPLGRCYLLPVPQLQAAYQANAERWWRGPEYFKARAENRRRDGSVYHTVSVCVPVGEVYAAITGALMAAFDPVDGEEP